MKQLFFLICFLACVFNVKAGDDFLNKIKSDKKTFNETVMFFYKPNCYYCISMEKEIQNNIEFQQLLTQNYNVLLVNLNTPEGTKIASLYSVKAVPTIVKYNQINYEINYQKGFGNLNVLTQFIKLTKPVSIKNKTENILATCGDGTLDAGEQCDDGNSVNGDGCETNCFNTTFCGDGTLDIGEQCDDANFDNTDACPNNCLFATCGDGFIMAGVEQCDDGNTVSGDGCEANCINTATCGDGTLDAGEQCDDANFDNTDACPNNCLFATCGDGFIMAGVEQCDDGNTVSGDGCSSTCLFDSNVGLKTLTTNNQEIDFVIFPIPIVDDTQVSFFLLHKSNVAVSVFDMEGKLITKQNIGSLEFGRNNFVLQNINSFVPAKYLIQITITNQNGIFNQTKIVVKK